MCVVGPSDRLASNESLQFLSGFEAIHDGHVAVHEDDPVGGGLLTANAWLREPILVPLHYLVLPFCALSTFMK